MVGVEFFPVEVPVFAVDCPRSPKRSGHGGWFGLIVSSPFFSYQWRQHSPFRRVLALSCGEV